MVLRRMKTSGAPRKQTKTYKTPKRPYEAPRLDSELKVRFFFRVVILPGRDGIRLKLSRTVCHCQEER